MSFCPKCGAELPKSGKFCVECGFDTEQFYRTPSDTEFAASSPVTPQQSFNGEQQFAPQFDMKAADSGSFGWAVLGFFIPIVGLVLWLVWKDEKPRCAKMAGVGALVSVGVSVAFTVLSIFAGCAAIAAFA